MFHKEDVKKRVDFIVAWYNKERFGLKFPQQMRLAKMWSDICAKNDEFEMADSLLKESEKVYKKFIEYKQAKRNPFKIYKFLFRKTWRKIKRMF